MVKFKLFRQKCLSIYYVQRLPEDFREALIVDVWFQVKQGFLKAKKLEAAAIRRVKDRSINLLNGETVTLKVLKESLKLDETISLDSISEWCTPSCSINYFKYKEPRFPTNDELATAIASLSSQGSRHFNKEMKQYLSLCNSEVQQSFITALAKAQVIREQKRHRR